MSRLRVYIAASLEQARWVDTIVTPLLESRGCEVISTWSRPPYPVRSAEESLTDEQAAIVQARNDRDLRLADAVLVIADKDSGETFAEAARAVSHGIRIVWVGRRILTAKRPGVTRVDGAIVDGVQQAANVLEQISIERFGRPWSRPRGTR